VQTRDYIKPSKLRPANFRGFLNISFFGIMGDFGKERDNNEGKWLRGKWLRGKWLIME
jgi:hypothetical protein